VPVLLDASALPAQPQVGEQLPLDFAAEGEVSWENATEMPIGAVGGRQGAAGSVDPLAQAAGTQAQPAGQDAPAARSAAALKPGVAEAIAPQADPATAAADIDTTTTTSVPVPATPGPDAAGAAARAMEALVPNAPHTAQQPPAASQAPAALQPLAPEAQFAEDNHPNIVAGVRGQLLPSGGTMQIRLDPPELGPLSVTIRLNDGVMEASFETQNDQAAKLLSHSLSTLKASLESQGVSVERLHVQQAPRSEQPGQQGGNGDRDSQQNQARDPQQEHAARQEHQRREMLKRMWRKLTGAEDPLDLVA
jgi:flagellar hook-length control protein FliK